jgi:hypothetical protein
MKYGTGRMQGISGLSGAVMDSILLHVRRLPASSEPQGR